MTHLTKENQMSAASPDGPPTPTRFITSSIRWLLAMAALLTALAEVLLILTGHTELVGPVAALGAAIVGGTAIKVTIQIRR
ncbi:hypothetical protein M8I34_32255 [Streptomyces sp. MCA2]|uniref:hypothetical protein n=1 Tax=Streptomyces sp. MCA2 TaxID=2944805 RepID=UPI0020224C61|nr:hypothetical protein [Streptomyces sp. MCA2]MCL7496042.1 hypothetical protein [Streptomyces sp. MCA2]